MPSQRRSSNGTLTAAEYRRLITESSFQDKVIQTAELGGWWVWHDTDSRRNRAGLPDLIMIRPPRVIFAELKKHDGRVRRSQQTVLGLLADCPDVESYLWRPDDFEAIERILARRGSASRRR